MHTIRAWIARRKIACVRLGRAVRVPVAEIDRLLDEGHDTRRTLPCPPCGIELRSRLAAVLYRRGGIWWFEFKVAGRRYRETTRTSSKTLAAEIERKRHREIETAHQRHQASRAAAVVREGRQGLSRAQATHLGAKDVYDRDRQRRAPQTGLRSAAADRHHGPSHQRLPADAEEPGRRPQDYQ